MVHMALQRACICLIDREKGTEENPKKNKTRRKRKPLNTPEGKSNVPKRAKAKYLFPD